MAEKKSMQTQCQRKDLSLLVCHRCLVTRTQGLHFRYDGDTKSSLSDPGSICAPYSVWNLSGSASSYLPLIYRQEAKASSSFGSHSMVFSLHRHLHYQQRFLFLLNHNPQVIILNGAVCGAYLCAAA